MAANTGGTVRVEGLRQLLRATDAADKATKKLVRSELRKVAVPVRDEARRLFASTDSKSASRFGISVRKVGTVSVEQRLRRTSGLRPDFGRLQMRKALVPALEGKADEVIVLFDKALERLSDDWGRGG